MMKIYNFEFTVNSQIYNSTVNSLGHHHTTDHHCPHIG